MAQQTINVGTAPNDGTGTPLRTAFQYTNSNFSELYTAVGPSGNNIVVPGNATISGDLTVATDALKVNSSTKDICIGTTTPTFNNKLTVVGGAGGDAFITSGNGTRTGYIGTDGTNVIMGAYSNHPLRIHVNDYPQMEVAALGVFNWYDGAGGTRMTLNSTGLGIGASPTQKLHVKGVVNFEQVSGGTNGWQVYTYTDGTYRMNYNGAGADELIIDTSGNVGIGVTPSAWVSYQKAIDFGGAGNYGSISARTDFSSFATNCYFNGTSWIYKNTYPAYSYEHTGGVHKWNTAPSGTAGTAITFTQAMTLDASGNLLVGTTSASNQERLNVSSALSLYVARVFNTASSGGNYGIQIRYSNAAPNNATNEFLACSDNAASRAFIYANGGLANYQANDSNLSDARTKTDIKPLASYWDKIKSLEVVTFKYKDQTHSDDNIGLIAQQVESVAPEFVSNEGFGEVPEDGVPLKTIYTTDLYHAAIKALQEAMTRIEALEAKLA